MTKRYYFISENDNILSVCFPPSFVFPYNVFLYIVYLLLLLCSMLSVSLSLCGKGAKVGLRRGGGGILSEKLIERPINVGIRMVM